MLILFMLVCIAGFFAILAAGAVGTASAQTGANLTDESTPTGERIDNNTVIVDKEYRPEEGRAILTIRSSERQTITLSDAGGFIEGGEIAQNTVRVDANSTQEIGVSVTKVQGFVGVSVATEGTLFAVRLQQLEKSSPGPISYQNAQLLVLLASIGTAGAVFRVVKKRRDDEDKEAERIL